MDIERNFMRDLQRWKESANRKPLLLKGVRQCGKSWLLRRFGKEFFSNVAVFNFDKDRNLASLFEKDYDTNRIITSLSAYCGERIVPQETLLIFDEIQCAPAALNFLKYFCEDASEYAVTAAGSLIGLTLASGNHSGFPVGKVDIRELSPCSFDEYLHFMDPVLHAYVKTIQIEPLADAFSAKLHTRFLEYLTLGGMPGVISIFGNTHDIHAAEEELTSIVLSYEADFSKHIPAKDIPKLSLIWHAIPVQFAKENRRFIYGEARPGARAKDLEDALQWLVNASMVQKVECADPPAYPLASMASHKNFKLYPTDVGILRKLAGITSTEMLDNQELFSGFKGKLTENYVLEQLRACGLGPVYYWYNETGRSEVDFLLQYSGQVIPVEVKSGQSLKAKSLKAYRDKFSPVLSIRASLQNLKIDDGLMNVPLYLLGELPRFLQGAFQK